MAQNPSPPETQQIVDETRRLADDARNLVDTIRRENPIGHYYDRNPYAVIAAAAGLGYILGGGLFSPFTRRILRVGFKAMALPVAASQLRQLAQTATGDNISIGQGSTDTDR